MHFLLLFGRVTIQTLADLINREWPFDETEQVAGDELLNLEGKILFYVVVCGAGSTEVIVCCEPDDLHLCIKIILDTLVVPFFNFAHHHLLHIKSVFHTVLIGFLDKSMYFLELCVEIYDSRFGLARTLIEVVQIVLGLVL